MKDGERDDEWPEGFYWSEEEGRPVAAWVSHRYDTPEAIAVWVEAGLPPWGCHHCRGAEYGPDGVPCPSCKGHSEDVEDPPVIARIRAIVDQMSEARIAQLRGVVASHVARNHDQCGELEEALEQPVGEVQSVPMNARIATTNDLQTTVEAGLAPRHLPGCFCKTCSAHDALLALIGRTASAEHYSQIEREDERLRDHASRLLTENAELRGYLEEERARVQRLRNVLTPPTPSYEEVDDDSEMTPEQQKLHLEEVRKVAEAYGFPLSTWVPTFPSTTCDICGQILGSFHVCARVVSH